jgi:glycosyltransferase involved in cell wall biosynthesis
MLLFLGRVGKEKGALDLIDAVVRLRRDFPEITVSIGGNGDIDVAMKRAHSYNLTENVHFLGWVRGTDKERLLQQATVYVLPSYSEGLPMSVLEAMAAGLPVVSTFVGGIPEAISDGEEGFLIQPGNVDELVNRLSLLLRDPQMRERMGNAARTKAEALFSVDCVLPKIEAVYTAIAGSRGA